MTVSLAVVDAADLVRGGIREIVAHSDEIDLIGDWSRVEDFYSSASDSKVDVLLVGDSATQKSLKQIVEQLLGKCPRLKVIVIASHFTGEMIDGLNEKGVGGFICKDEALSEILLGAIGLVKRGEVYISPKTARTLFMASNGSGPSFSQRQIQVLHYMSDYLTPQEIARKMDTSVSSIYNLQQRMREALGVKTSGQILIEATKQGLIGGQEAS